MGANVQLFAIFIWCLCSSGQAFSVPSVVKSFAPGCLLSLRMKGGDDGQSLTLNDGTKHPIIGFGTYKVGFIPASASSASKDPTNKSSTGPSARECVR